MTASARLGLRPREAWPCCGQDGYKSLDNLHFLFEVHIELYSKVLCFSLYIEKRNYYNCKYVKKAAILDFKVKYRSHDSKDIKNEFLDSKSLEIINNAFLCIKPSKNGFLFIFWRQFFFC